ncbi:DUF7563 family protein [Salinadaptatus halalkaliphilus]
MDRCITCGSPVSRQYVRVCGNNQGNVDECPNCSGRTSDSHLQHTAPPRL